MSQENVDTLHEVADAIAEQDLARLLDLTDPEVEWCSFLSDFGAVYKGHQGIRQYMADLGDSMELFLSEIEDTLAIGDVVLMVAKLGFRGRGSRVEAEIQAGYVVRFRDHRVLHFRAFRDPEQAISAIGLSE
jgi:ketosteroid isomerase-like protein